MLPGVDATVAFIAAAFPCSAGGCPRPVNTCCDQNALSWASLRPVTLSWNSARWDITSGVALKADVTHVRGFEDAAGGLNPAFVLTNDDESTNVYTLKLDSAF